MKEMLTRRLEVLEGGTNYVPLLKKRGGIEVVHLREKTIGFQRWIASLEQVLKKAVKIWLSPTSGEGLKPCEGGASNHIKCLAQ